MAYGDIGSSVLDSLEFETVKATAINTLPLGDGYIAVFYTENDTNGVVKTYSIDTDGSITLVDSWTFKSGNFEAGYAANVSGTIYVAAGRVGSDVIAYTISISDAGVITKSIIQSATIESGSSFTVAQILKKTNTTAFLFMLSSQDIYTALIANDGSTITQVDSWDTGNASNNPHAAYIVDDVFAIAQSDGVLRTFSVDDSGNITKSFIDTQTIDGARTAVNNHIKHVINNVYVVAYLATSNATSYLSTFTISDAGAISAVLDNVTLATITGGPPRLYRLGPTASIGYFVADWVSTGSDAFCHNFSVDTSGNINLVGGAFEYWSNVAQASTHRNDGFCTGRASVSGVMVQGLPDTPGNDGFLKTINIENDDTSGIILEIALNQSIFTETPTWTDISEYLVSIHIERGRNHELNRIEAGTAIFVLNNSDGNFWRGNTASDYYPYVKPLILIRARREYNFVEYPLYYGIVETWNHRWQDEDAGYEPEVEVHCVDIFKSLNRAKIVGVEPQTGAEAASGQKDIVIGDDFGSLLSYMYAGQSFKIDGGGNSEINTIASIDTDTLTITAENNLANTYPVGSVLTKFPQVLSGIRIKDVLLEWGWSAGLMDLDAGQNDVAEFAPGTVEVGPDILAETDVGTNALEHIQAIAESEGGIVFIGPDGHVVFQDSVARQNDPYDTSQATFIDDGNDSKYSRPQIADEDEFIYNQADISGESINAQSVRDTTAQALQGARIFPRTNSQLVDDLVAWSQAYIIVARYTDSLLRPKQFVVKPEASPDDLYPKALGYDISTRITLQLDSTRNPAEIDQEYHIEGITHDWNAESDFWLTTWQLWEVNQYRIVEADHDGYFQITGTDYDTIHDAASSDSVENDGGGIAVGQNQEAVAPPPYAYSLWRGFLEFDTSIITADRTVDEATIVLVVDAYEDEDEDWNVVIVDPDTLTAPIAVGDFDVLLSQTTDWGNVAIDTPRQEAVVKMITLSAAAIASINKTGLTRFGLRSSNDIDDVSPGPLGASQEFIVFWGVGSDYPPRLIVKLSEA